MIWRSCSSALLNRPKHGTFLPKLLAVPLPRNNNVSLWNHHFYALYCCAATAILACDHDLMAAPDHGLGEVAEMTVLLNVGDLLAVDDQGGTGLGAADHFDYVALQLGVVDLQKHILLLALCDEREFVGFADVAQVVLLVDGANTPEIIPGLQA